MRITMSDEKYLTIRLQEAAALHLLLSRLGDSNLLWEDVRAYAYKSKKKINLLLLGKTGYGKSATGNTVLGRSEFESKRSMTSVTAEVKCSQFELGDYLVNVIDCPGLADTNFIDKKDVEIEQMIKKMENIIDTCDEGIQAFLYVVRFGCQFLKEDETTLDFFKHIFGHNFLKDHGIIIFTCGDDFDHAMEEEGTPKKSFLDWCRCQRGVLGNLMKECGYRCVLVNNKEKDEEQKKIQMKTLMNAALNFDEEYTYVDYVLCKDERNKLLVTLKTPQLKKTFGDKINILSSEIQLVCLSEGTSLDELERLTSKAFGIADEIYREDMETGLLKDLHKKATHTAYTIMRHKEREEARRRPEKPCKIF